MGVAAGGTSVAVAGIGVAVGAAAGPAQAASNATSTKNERLRVRRNMVNTPFNRSLPETPRRLGDPGWTTQPIA